MEKNTICLCEHCIEAIQSRGDELFVGPINWDWSDYETEHPCEWCDEMSEDLHICIMN